MTSGQTTVSVDRKELEHVKNLLCSSLAKISVTLADNPEEQGHIDSARRMTADCVLRIESMLRAF